MVHPMGCVSLSPFADLPTELIPEPHTSEPPSIPPTTTASQTTRKNRGMFHKERHSPLVRKKGRKLSKSSAEQAFRAQTSGGTVKSIPARSFKSFFGDRTHPTQPTEASSSSSRKEPRPSRSHSSSSSSIYSGLFSGTNKTNPYPNHTKEQELRSLIQPRLANVFTPSLPSELWLLILKYAAYPPASLSTPTTSTSASTPAYPYPYPYPTTYDPSCTPVSFLSLPTAQTHRDERLAAYKAHMQAKAVLTRVCRVWNAIAQEVLYEFVWIASGKEGRALAERLCADGGTIGGLGVGGTTVVSVGTREKEKGRFGSWIGRTKGPAATKHTSKTTTTPMPDTVVHRKSSLRTLAPLSVGRFIKRLHVETRTLDRCSPHDLLLILQHCPQLEEYSDYKSVRRPMHPLTISLSDILPFSASSSVLHNDLVSQQQHHQQAQAQALLTPDALLHAILSRPLKRLTWTNYDYDASDFYAGMRFYEDVVAPRLEVVGAGLEFLELMLSRTAAFGMGKRAEVGWGVGGSRSGVVSVGGGDEGNGSEGSLLGGFGSVGQHGRSEGRPVMCKNPAVGMYGAANMLTDLEASFTKTTMMVSNEQLGLDVGVGATSSTAEVQMSIDGFSYALCLPSLASLKATLDNATFHVLSTWDMPLLTHLSIVSADFSYAGPGFRKFFEVHGSKLIQLELGHSSNDIEEAWVTEPTPPFTDGPVDPLEGFRIPLDAWCPALKEFICSADAEWNWRSPDWIAPHVLLPTHLGVEFIGVRGMEKRLVADLDGALRRRMQDGWRGRNFGQGGHGDGDNDSEGEGNGEMDSEDDPYFVLLQQFSSFLRAEAFPSLRFVRDMSWESDIMRRTGRMRPLPPSASASTFGPPPPIPLERANASSIFQQQSLATSSSSSWWMRSASSTGGAKKLKSKASAVQLAARHVEEALAKSYGRRLNGFWKEVQGMCHARGVWLEDCRGVNITSADLRRAAMR